MSNKNKKQNKQTGEREEIIDGISREKQTRMPSLLVRDNFAQVCRIHIYILQYIFSS